MSFATRSAEESTKAAFARDSENLVLTVKQDDGLYRHLVFAAPGRSFDRFEILTWPGHLTITGGHGTWTFRRTEDMLEFFRDSRGWTRINPGYWGEKLVGGLHSGNRSCEAYDGDYFTQQVNEHVDEFLADDGRGCDWPADVREEFRQAIVDEVLTDDYGNRPAATNDLAHGNLHTFRFETSRAGTTYRFEFSDTWEWDLTTSDYHFLWSCWAIAHAVSEYDKHVAAAQVEVMGA